MTPNLEIVTDMLIGEPNEDDRGVCFRAILPVVRDLVIRGIPPNAIIETLAKATVETIRVIGQ